VIFGCPSLKIVPRAALVSASCPPKSPLDQLAGLAERELASAADPVEAESTDEEWDAFLAHFEKRKVSIGTCARAYATPCVHEHACVRCALLRADPAQQARLEEIRDNLHARIAEAEREGWLGEVEGLKVSLAGAEDKLTQIDTTLRRRANTIHLGTPTFTDLAGRTPSP
jgi:hypothetical protein